MKIMAIDPGLHYLGYVIASKKPFKIMHHGVIHHGGTMHWKDRMKNVLSDVFTIYRKHMPSDIVLEVPEHWSGGVGFAARESGSIWKLTLLVGAIYGIFLYNELGIITLLSPSQWKGQLKKDLCHKRLNKLIPNIKDITDNNTLDAVGLAYFYSGGKI